MSSSTSHRQSTSAHKRGAHGGGGGGSQDGGGGGGGGGGGRLIKVAFARNQAEAEMLQGLLSEAGIPSVLKRSGGFDNPDFLAAGPHDVMVQHEVAPRAREVLAETMVESEAEERGELLGEAARLRSGGGDSSAVRLAFWIGIAFLGAVLLVWLLYQAS